MELTQLLPGPKGAREASRSFKRVGNRATCPLWRVSGISGLKGGPEIKFGQEVEVYSQTGTSDGKCRLAMARNCGTCRWGWSSISSLILNKYQLILTCGLKVSISQHYSVFESFEDIAAQE